MTKEEANKIVKKIIDWRHNNPTDSTKMMEIAEAIEIVLSQHSLPPNLDEAAEKYANRGISSNADPYEETASYQADKDTFKAGAEWMAGQGYVEECTVRRTPLNGPAGICMNLYECDGFKLGDKVIVQIRKKQ